MPLLSLPNELLLQVGRYCSSQTLHTLILTNRRLNILLTHVLHKLAPEDKGHFTALTWAASRGHLPLVRLLIQQGVDLDLQDKYGSTALQWAVMDGNAAVVKALIDAGADIHARDRYCFRPIDRARILIGYSRTEISSWDKSCYRGPVDRSLWRMTSDRERGGAITKLLLESGADPQMFGPPLPPRVSRARRLSRWLCHG